MTPTREEVIRVALECGFYGAEVDTHEQRLERLAQHFYEAGAAAAREPLSDGVVREKARLWLQQAGSYRGMWSEETERSAQTIERLYCQVFREAEAAHGIAKATGEKT